MSFWYTSTCYTSTPRHKIEPAPHVPSDSVTVSGLGADCSVAGFAQVGRSDRIKVPG
jgi:hypothetical protein